MSDHTDIAYCDSTCNCVMGCDGCELWNRAVRNCYAGELTLRYAGSKGWPKSFALPTEFPGRMAAAAKWKDLRGVVREDKPWIPAEYPRLVFVSDMGDALSKDISFDYLYREIVQVVAGWKHIGLWLTKRASRMVEFDRWLESRGVDWPQNLWAGTSITTQKTIQRAINLQLLKRAPKRFISFEPLLERLDFEGDMAAFADWAIIGAASGTQLPDCGLPALIDLAEQAQHAGVPLFIKQDYALKPGQQGRIRDEVWAYKQFPALPAQPKQGDLV